MSEENISTINKKIWNMADVLRDDGVSNIIAINSQLFNGAIAQSCVTGNSASNVGLYNRFYTANNGAPSGNIYQEDQKNTIFKADNWITKQYNDTNHNNNYTTNNTNTKPVKYPTTNNNKIFTN